MNAQPAIPKFRDEAEEAQWWFDHRDETASWMEDAAAQGQTSSLSEILQKRQGASASTVSVGIDPADIARAKALAVKRGLGYQAYLKMLLHEALELENRRLAG